MDGSPLDTSRMRSPLDRSPVDRSPVDGNPVDVGQVAADADDSPVPRPFEAWRRWRRSRPFWGGLLVLLAGAEILLSERAPLPVVIHVGMQGLAGYLVPTVLVLCGLLIWFSPAQRTFYSILAVLLSLGSWITSNLGGFFVGMALGVVGGSLAFAWARGSGPPAPLSLRPQRREPAGGLDVILGDPEESSRPVRGLTRRQPSAGEDTEPIRDDPRGRPDAAAPDQPASASGPRTGRRPPTGSLGLGLFTANVQLAT
jgi:hypothetical protein